jgi:Putative MetA-pathway of phenol degradation
MPSSFFDSKVRVSRFRAIGLGLTMATATVWLPSPAQACSICRCGDPTFNALGKEGYATKGWRLALDWERFDKEEGPPSEEAEELVENRVTALASYGFSDSFSVYARIPFSFRSFTEIEENEPVEQFDTQGLSDPEVYGQVRLWASPLSSPLGRRTSLSLLAGIKAPLGQNDYTRDGERVDEHAQPGTGSWDAFGGLALVHLLDPKSALFASVQYRHTGENDLDYRYGRIFLANAAYERKLAHRLDSALELNYRYAGKDREGVEELPNTGGSILYLTPRLLVDVGGGVILRAAVQIPIARSLNGVQEEKAVANVGVTVLLGGR